MSLKTITGEQFEQALTEDATYTQLRTNLDTAFPDTRKRQHATSEVSINKVLLTPMANALQVRSYSRSNSHHYKQVLIFSDVDYNPPDPTMAATFMGTDRQQHTITPINLREQSVKVSCSCLDFHYRFAAWNHEADALSSQPPPPYIRKTQTRPPANPMHAPGMCKHIVKLVDILKRRKLVR